MKNFLIAVLVELIVVAIVSTFLFFVWNHMASNYFHYKDIDFIQSVMITALFRILIIKLD